MRMSHALRSSLLAALSGMTAGCSLAAAPSYELFGAYFPAWMLCALVGIGAAAGARAILTIPRFDGVVPFQLAVCTAVGVAVALLIWSVLFR